MCVCVSVCVCAYACVCAASSVCGFAISRIVWSGLLRSASAAAAAPAPAPMRCADRLLQFARPQSVGAFAVGQHRAAIGRRPDEAVRDAVRVSVAVVAVLLRQLVGGGGGCVELVLAEHRLCDGVCESCTKSAIRLRATIL